MDDADADQRLEDPTLDFLLRWRDGEEPRVTNWFEVLNEIACEVAEQFKCHVSIDIGEPQEHEGTSMNIAPETVQRLIRERER